MAAMFSVLDQNGKAVPASFLYVNGKPVVDPNTARARSTPLYDASGGTLLPGDEQNVNGYLIVPASFTIQQAKDFANDAVDQAFLSAETESNSTEYAAAYRDELAQQFIQAFVQRGSEDLQRSYGGDSQAFVSAFTDAASYNLGLTSAFAGIPLIVAELGGGVYNEIVSLTAGNLRTPIDTSGFLFNAAANERSIKAGYAEALDLSKNPMPSGFVGDVVTLSHYYTAVNPSLIAQGTATVSDTAVEFPNLRDLPVINPTPPGVGTAPRSYDLNDNTLTIDYLGSATSLPGSLDVISLDPSDKPITGVTLESSTVSGFSQSSISFTPYSISLDFSNVTGAAGDAIVIDATFAPTTSATAAVTDPVVTQSGVTISGDSSELYNVTGNELSDNIGVLNTSPVFLSGNGDSLSLSGATSSFAITDNGQGSLIDLAGLAPSPGSTITLNNFQSDPTGSILLPSQYATAAAALAALQPDGQGGSILPLTSGASLHFAGDNHLTAASFVVGHTQS